METPLIRRVVTLLLLPALALMLAAAALRPASRPPAAPEATTVSALVGRQLAEFHAKPEPLAFALSATGRYATYRWCPEGSGCDVEIGRRLALEDCARHRLDGPCRLLTPAEIASLRPEGDLGMQARPAEGLTVQGPASALGVILYVPGYDAWAWPHAAAERSVPPWVRALAALGWDVRAIGTPYYNRHPLMLPDLAAALRRLTLSARGEGYRRVVLAGQSRGAWEVLLAAPAAADALILTAPAAHGMPAAWSGGPNRLFEQARKDFAAAIVGLDHPRVAVALFARDGYDPGGRERLIRRHQAEALAAGRLWLIDRPPGLAGHGAALEPLFAALYARCLQSFILADPGTRPPRCRPPPLPDPATAPLDLLASLEAVRAAGFIRLDEPALARMLPGREGYNPLDRSRMRWHHSGRLELELDGDYVLGQRIQARWRLDSGRLCILDSPVHPGRRSCESLWQRADGALMRVRLDGSATALRLGPSRVQAAAGLDPTLPMEALPEQGGASGGTPR